MKKLIFGSLIISIVLTSCGKNKKEDSTGKDLNSIKKELMSKKAEVAKLNKEIKTLQDKIYELDPNSRKKTSVTLFPIEKKDFKRFSEFQGTVQAADVTKISAEIPGRITELYVENGDRVKKGQLLAKLDIESLQKKLEELEKSYELAADVFERQKRLWKKNIGSEIQFLSAKNNKERLEKGIESLKVQLKKSNIYAPSSGIIDNKMAEQGEMTAPGAPLMLLLNTNTVKIISELPENYLRSVNINQKLDIEIPALDIKTSGKISKIGNVINAINRTFTVEISIRNIKNKLKPNLLALVKVNDLSVQEAIVIPNEIIQHELSGKPFVMIAKKTGDKVQAEKRYLEVGDSYEGNTVVKSGLTLEDKLIDKGARNVNEGQLIEINPENKK